MGVKVSFVPDPVGRKELYEYNEKAAAMMATDIHSRSAVLAPKDTRNLVNSGKITRLGKAHYAVTYGSAKVPYARIHELGGMTGKDYKVHIVAKHYLEQAGESVVRGNLGKYYEDYNPRKS